MSGLIYLCGGAQSSWDAKTSQSWEYSHLPLETWKHDANAVITLDPKAVVRHYGAI